MVIDAGGMTAIPGLIDRHVHITFGDYTPRQRTVGFLESYVHGGITTAISASEVHVPGRPSDPEGVKALARRRTKLLRALPAGRHEGHGRLGDPGAGADRSRFRGAGRQRRLAREGRLWRGQDAFRLRAADARRESRRHDHDGATPAARRSRVSGAISGDHLLAMQPHVSFHVNGGPTAMPDADFARIINESKIALQVCTAGNLRTTLLWARLPTQLGLSTASSSRPTRRPAPASCRSACSTPSRIARAWPPCRRSSSIAAATGNNARVYGLDSGFLGAGKAADIVLIDAPVGGTQNTALAAIKHGDIAAIGARHHRRRAALRRPQPQHPGHHSKGAGCEIRSDSGFRYRQSLAAKQNQARPYLQPLID